MKTKMGVLMLAVLLFSVSNSFAEEMKPEKEAVVESTDVGNKICPVDEAKIGSMGEAIKVEHEGKIYSLCCEACVKAFKEDPEKFHKIADKEGKDHVDTEHSHSDHKHDEHK